MQLELAIRTAENDLWDRGVRILSPEENAARYAAARQADPNFAALRRLLTRIADWCGQYERIELLLVEDCREGAALIAFMRRLRRKYDEMLAEEEGLRQQQGLGDCL